MRRSCAVAAFALGLAARRWSVADTADKPIRIFGGTPDDYNPVARCKPYVER